MGPLVSVLSLAVSGFLAFGAAFLASMIFWRWKSAALVGLAAAAFGGIGAALALPIIQYRRQRAIDVPGEMEPQPSFDLRQDTLVTENRSETSPGDVSLYRSPQAACASLEAWWVKDRDGAAITANGDRLVLAPTEPVSVRSREPHPDGERLVRLWLEALAEHLRKVRRDVGPLPSSVPELIAYIGFAD
jgi:hypothetical protein